MAHLKKKISRISRATLGTLACVSPLKTRRFGYPNRIIENLPWLAVSDNSPRPDYVESVQQLPTRADRVITAPKPVRLTDPNPWDWCRRWTPRPRRVVVLKNMRVCYPHTLVTPDQAILWELSPLWNTAPAKHPLLRCPVLPAARRLHGRTLCLSVDSGDNYFHWLLDLLPRLKVLEDAGIDIGSFDHYLVNALDKEFQRESLVRWGIPLERVIATNHQRHLETETLVVPSQAEQSGIFDGTDLARVQAVLLARHPENLKKFPRRFFINRQKTRGRNLTNFDEVSAVLNKHGFASVQLEQLAFTEQIALFSGAEIILAAHGAGLTNFLFCQPGTKVLELVSPHYAHQMYYYLATVLGLDYHYLMGTSVGAPTEPVFQDIHVDASFIEAQFSEWTSSRPQ